MENDYENGLKKIRIGKNLPNFIAIVVILFQILGLTKLFEVKGIILCLYNFFAIAFFASIVWYFRLKCPRCRKRFVNAFTLNTRKWVNPKNWVVSLNSLDEFD